MGEINLAANVAYSADTPRVSVNFTQVSSPSPAMVGLSTTTSTLRPSLVMVAR